MSATSVPVTFEIKSAQLPLVALLLKTPSLDELARDWAQQFAQTPGFFDQDPLVIDLTPLAQQSPAETPDFQALVDWLRRQNVSPVAVKGGSPPQMAAALAVGLVAAPDVVLSRAVAAPAPAAPVVAEPPAAPPVPPSALVVDRPLRSGQQVYARGRDLVVLAMVNPGAEVIADGHIHVYAPLRGKAIAGARGNGDARIFALSLEAELISIAGVYRTSDVPLPAAVAGQAAVVRLDSGPEGDKLVMEPLKG